MGNFVTQGAVLQCSFGLSPCTLVITVPSRHVSIVDKPGGILGYVCRYGCADTDALCASNLSSLVTRQFSGKGGWYSCADRQ